MLDLRSAYLKPVSSVKGNHGFALDIQVKQFLPKASKQTLNAGRSPSSCWRALVSSTAAFGTALHGCTKSGFSTDLRQAKSEGGG